MRLIHLGLGAFHRAHQVWYTQHAEADPAHPEWGYASFTGRGPRMADLLAPQDGLYTLVTRSGEGDSPELITSLVEARPAADLPRLVELMADPDVAVVTLTVTEAGYHLDGSGDLDVAHDDVAADLKALSGLSGDSLDDASELHLATAAGRIVAGLIARRAASAGGMAVMSCDNIADNGALTRASVLGLATAVDAELADWIAAEVTFPSTSIDRITPATNESLLDDVEKHTGFADAAPVVTEPFASWIIEGEFPAGRPEWERAGAEFVDDIAQFERRKLWLLNGSHSLMAYLGQLRGHDTVADAIGDPEVRGRVIDLWGEAARHLTADGLDVPAYREALIERFENPRIVHNLAQIAIDGATKQRMRAVPILKAELAAGRDGAGAAASVAAWVAFVLDRDGDVADTRADEIAAAAGDADDPVRALVAVLDDGLAADDDVVERIRAAVDDLTDSPDTDK
ncbi:mannitol dehydrogenase family protein [uncultured Corynebacterium sp.]|uniref:mannitol dehydrogenase family protein n=1 Tax=uncultured Corynebacterium sp. TaxID=159447 RepID=UPI0025FA2357|nr:mannitol dehydrogenase family protein [uncultured Corynebacterium sp.]